VVDVGSAIEKQIWDRSLAVKLHLAQAQPTGLSIRLKQVSLYRYDSLNPCLGGSKDDTLA